MTWMKLSVKLPPIQKLVLVKRAGRMPEIAKRVPGYLAFRGVYFETAAGHNVRDMVAWMDIPEYEEKE